MLYAGYQAYQGRVTKYYLYRNPSSWCLGVGLGGACGLGSFVDTAVTAELITAPLSLPAGGTDSAPLRTGY